MPVRKTGQLPENIDRQVNEIIRAFSEMEEQIRQIRKASDPRTGDNAEYIDRHVRNLKNPHSVTAKQVKALPLAFVLDQSSICFPFQNSLVSTRGASPIGLYGSSITDYGLVTGNDLCATLLPEGGVAVTEGTTNLLTNPSFENGTTGWSVNNFAGRLTIVQTSDPVWHGSYAYKITGAVAGDTAWYFAQNVPVSAGATYTLSFYVYSHKSWGSISGNQYSTGIVWRDAGGVAIRTDNVSSFGDTTGKWSRVVLTATAPTGAVSANVRIGMDRPDIAVGEWLVIDAIQFEQKPFATPFVDGTRPAGSLSYDLPISINGDWTISKWVELEPYYMDKTLTGDNAIGKWRLPLIEIGNGYNVVGKGLIGIYGARLASVPGKTMQMIVNKDQSYIYSSTITLTETEYSNKILVALIKEGLLLTAHLFTITDHHVLTCDISSFGDISQILPQLNYHTVVTPTPMYCKRHLNTLVRPYAVSPETVATWHSLDAPFIDPFIPPSQGVPYFNTPGEFINSTANFAMVNVDGLVKLYARTPDKTIIIETLGNTEVV